MDRWTEGRQTNGQRTESQIDRWMDKHTDGQRDNRHMDEELRSRYRQLA